MNIVEKFKLSWDRDREDWGFGILLFLFHFVPWLLWKHTILGILFSAFLICLYFFLDDRLENNPLSLKLNSDGFEIFEGDEKKAAYQWSNLFRFEVITGSGGPWKDDVWFFFKFEDDSISLPMSMDGLKDLIPEFSKLPGYDESQFIAAMGSTKNDSFLCFQR